MSTEVAIRDEGTCSPSSALKSWPDAILSAESTSEAPLHDAGQHSSFPELDALGVGAWIEAGPWNPLLDSWKSADSCKSVIPSEPIVRAERADESNGTKTVQHPSPRYQEPCARKMACPFYKSSPQNRLRHACGSHGFPSVARLKEHIYRNHTLHRCQKCNKSFDSATKFSDHPCLGPGGLPTPNPSIHLGVVSPQQVLQLQSRLGMRNLTEEDRWRQVYSIIFGADAKIPSPYLDMDDYSLPSESGPQPSPIQAGFENALRQALEEAIGETLSAVQTDLHSQISTIVERCKERLREGSTDLCTQSDHRQPHSARISSYGHPSPTTVLSADPNSSRCPDLLPTQPREDVPVEQKQISFANTSSRIEHDASRAFIDSLPTPATPLTSKPYYCPYCLEEGMSLSMKTKHDWKRHIMNFHESSWEWRCRCGEVFHREREHLKHLKKMHPSWSTRDILKVKQPNKYVYACGFTDCIKISHTFKDWCNHVAAEMVEDSPRAWSYTWRVYNLLRHPDFANPWKEVMTQWSCFFNVLPQALSWDPKASRDIVTSLETHVYKGSLHTLLQELFRLGMPSYRPAEPCSWTSLELNRAWSFEPPYIQSHYSMKRLRTEEDVRLSRAIEDVPDVKGFDFDFGFKALEWPDLLNEEGPMDVDNVPFSNISLLPVTASQG